MYLDALIGIPPKIYPEALSGSTMMINISSVNFSEQLEIPVEIGPGIQSRSSKLGNRVVWNYKDSP